MPSDGARMTADPTSPVYHFDASKSRFSYAWRDITDALKKPHLIFTLVANDISNRYKGAALGAFWISLTTLATVTGLAVLYGKILGADLKDYYPYVTTGIIVWGLISGLLNDGAGVFVGGSLFLTQTPLPKTLLVLRAIGRALWALFFKLLVLVGVLIISDVKLSLATILISIAGLCIVVWTGFFVALGVGTIAARFRDFGQFVDVGLTFSFFATPIFWRPERLGEYADLIRLNPFHHYVNIIRGPLTGAPDVSVSFIWAGIMTIVVTAVGSFVFANFARRLSYWC